MSLSSLLTALPVAGEPALAELTAPLAYAPVDRTTPSLLFWLGVILLVASLALIAHALWRRRRFRSGADLEDSRYEGPGRGRDALIQLVVGIVFAVGSAVLVTVALFSASAAEDAIAQNLREGYGVTEIVQVDGWQGRALYADVRLADGTLVEDVMIVFSEDGVPQSKRLDELTGR